MRGAHTPGPWEAKRFHVLVEGKGIVASVPSPWNDEAERQANTNLIAAAPLTIQALADLRDEVRDWQEALGDERPSLTVVCARADEALKAAGVSMKSEGEITGAMERLRIGREEAATVDYLGDGVYSTFDGHHIWLRTLEGMAIVLEPSVLTALDSYRKGLKL